MKEHYESKRVYGCKHCMGPMNPLGASTYHDVTVTNLGGHTSILKGTCGNTGMRGVVFTKVNKKRAKLY